VKFRIPSSNFLEHNFLTDNMQTMDSNVIFAMASDIDQIGT
jgi:hypothetical protein